MELERLVAQLMTKMERRVYGKHRAIVIDNEDPEHLGRLKLSSPVFGKDNTGGWATPCVPYAGDANQGMLFIPEKGAAVWLEFEAGDIDRPLWVGSYWSKTDGESELPKPNDADGVEEGEVQTPHTRKIIKTLKGHTLQFEDKDGEECITIIQQTDGDEKNVITLSNSGITVTDFSGNKIEMIESGITMTDISGNMIEMSDSAFNIVSTVALTIDASGQEVKIKASAIDLISG
jgi:uncharacterized protein involved in type VI secretion and phage assembly